MRDRISFAALTRLATAQAIEQELAQQRARDASKRMMARAEALKHAEAAADSAMADWRADLRARFFEPRALSERQVFVSECLQTTSEADARYRAAEREHESLALLAARAQAKARLSEQARQRLRRRIRRATDDRATQIFVEQKQWSAPWR